VEVSEAVEKTENVWLYWLLVALVITQST